MASPTVQRAPPLSAPRSTSKHTPADAKTCHLARSKPPAYVERPVEDQTMEKHYFNDDPFLLPHDPFVLPSGFLVASPYTRQSHLLGLSTVDTSSRLLAKALTTLRPIRDDYATAPYELGFNWTLVLNALNVLIEAEHDFDWKDQFFYVVVFRSQLLPGTDRSHLGLLDDGAHAEAMESGGLLKYWFGAPDENRRNMATCVWRELNDASAGSKGPAHKRATRETRDLYSEWKIERLRLEVRDGGLDWDIVQWQD